MNINAIPPMTPAAVLTAMRIMADSSERFDMQYQAAVQDVCRYLLTGERCIDLERSIELVNARQLGGGDSGI